MSVARLLNVPDRRRQVLLLRHHAAQKPVESAIILQAARLYIDCLNEHEYVRVPLHELLDRLQDIVIDPIAKLLEGPPSSCIADRFADILLVALDVQTCPRFSLGRQLLGRRSFSSIARQLLESVGSDFAESTRLAAILSQRRLTVRRARIVIAQVLLQCRQAVGSLEPDACGELLQVLCSSVRLDRSVNHLFHAIACCRMMSVPVDWQCLSSDSEAATIVSLLAQDRADRQEAIIGAPAESAFAITVKAFALVDIIDSLHVNDALLDFILRLLENGDEAQKTKAIALCASLSATTCNNNEQHRRTLELAVLRCPGNAALWKALAQAGTGDQPLSASFEFPVIAEQLSKLHMIDAIVELAARRPLPLSLLLSVCRRSAGAPTPARRVLQAAERHDRQLLPRIVRAILAEEKTPLDALLPALLCIAKRKTAMSAPFYAEAELARELLAHRRFRLEAVCAADGALAFIACELMFEYRKPSAPFDPIEVDLLSLAFNRNATRQQVRFRQPFLHTVRRLVERLSVSSFNLEKGGAEGSEDGNCNCQVAALVGHSIELGLVPTACYARRTVSVSLLTTIIDVFHPQKAQSSHRRRDCPPTPRSTRFNPIEHIRPRRQLVSLLTQLLLIETTVPTRNALAYAIGRLGAIDGDDRYVDRHHQLIKPLLASAAPRDAETVALLSGIVARSSASKGEELFDELLETLREQLIVAHVDLLRAVESEPLYPVITALHSVFLAVSSGCITGDLWCRVARTIAVCDEAAESVSEVVNAQTSKDFQPLAMDFYEPPPDIMQRIGKQASSSGSDSSPSSSSACAQQLYVCTWRTMQSISILFGDLAERLALPDVDEETAAPLLDSLKQHFVRQLLEARHQGVFETALDGYRKWCAASLRRSRNRWQLQRTVDGTSDAMLIVADVMAMLLVGDADDATSGAASSSIRVRTSNSRRSAGLPGLVVIALVHGVEKGPAREAATASVLDLLFAEIDRHRSSRREDETEADAEVLVHLINIVSEILREERLHAASNAFVGRAIELAVEMLDSVGGDQSAKERWPITSAASNLYAMLISSRCFGAGANRRFERLSWRENSTPASTLFLAWPHLLGSFADTLRHWLEVHRARLAPSVARVVAVCNILARLHLSQWCDYMAEADGAFDIDGLRELLGEIICCCTPDESLLARAAVSALVALLTPFSNDTDRFGQRIADELRADCAAAAPSFGQLLLVKRVLVDVGANLFAPKRRAELNSALVRRIDAILSGHFDLEWPYRTRAILLVMFYNSLPKIASDDNTAEPESAKCAAALARLFDVELCSVANARSMRAPLPVGFYEWSLALVDTLLMMRAADDGVAVELLSKLLSNEESRRRQTNRRLAERVLRVWCTQQMERRRASSVAAAPLDDDDVEKLVGMVTAVLRVEHHVQDDAALFQCCLRCVDLSSNADWRRHTISNLYQLAVGANSDPQQVRRIADSAQQCIAVRLAGRMLTDDRFGGGGERARRVVALACACNAETVGECTPEARTAALEALVKLLKTMGANDHLPADNALFYWAWRHALHFFNDESEEIRQAAGDWLAALTGNGKRPATALIWACALPLVVEHVVSRGGGDEALLHIGQWLSGSIDLAVRELSDAAVAALAPPNRSDLLSRQGVFDVTEATSFADDVEWTDALSEVASRRANVGRLAEFDGDCDERLRDLLTTCLRCAAKDEQAVAHHCGAVHDAALSCASCCRALARLQCLLYRLLSAYIVIVCRRSSSSSVGDDAGMLVVVREICAKSVLLHPCSKRIVELESLTNSR